MAFHLPFSYKRRYLPQTEVQNDFSGGMIRDVPPHEIPLNASYYLNDFLIDQHGKLYRRGPFGALNSNTPAWGLASGLNAPQNIYSAYYPTANSNNAITFAVNGHNDHLYYSLGGASSTDMGAASWVSAGYVTQWAFYIDKTYASLGLVGLAPKYITWTGTTATVATLSGAPNITTIGLYKNRIIGGIGNRLYFSDVPDPTTAWDTTNSWIDCEHAISQLVGLRNVLLVFSANGVERIIGDTPPPNSNMDRTTISNIGLGTAISNGQKPVTVWNDNAIYANDQGVFMTNGNAPVDLTVKGGISSLYRSRAASSSPGVSGINLGIYRNYLIVAGLDTDILVYDLLRNSWLTIGGSLLPSQIRYMSSAVINGQDELLIACPQNTQILKASTVFNPTTAAYAETALEIGYGVLQPHLTTRAYTGSGITNRKRFSFARVTHNLHDPSTLNPSWSVIATPGLVQETTPKATVTLNETTKVQRSKVNIASESMAMQLDIKTTFANAAALADIYAIEVEAASLPFDFEGST